MRAFQLPSFMCASETGQVVQRLCPALPVDSPATRTLALALLFVSWEYDYPNSQLVQTVLEALPDYVRAQQDSQARPDRPLLTPSTVRVAMAREYLKSETTVLETLSQHMFLQDSVFSATGPECLAAIEAASAAWSATGELVPTLPVSVTSASAPVKSAQPALAPAPEQAPSKKGEPLSKGHALALYDKQDVARVWSQMSSEESNASLRRLLSQLDAGSSLRALTQVPDLQRLTDLEARFPHFDAVLAFVRQSLALASMGAPGKAVAIPPLLLRGPPGTGKSYFAQQLALALGCAYEERDLGVTSEAFVLMGMDPSWKYGKPGLVFDALVRGTTANPVICLNEVDKAKGSASSNSPIQALYTLLEPANSGRFKDEFVGVTIDASRVVWVLTANEGHIPEPILTRLETFEIPFPSPTQCRAIAQSVWADLLLKAFPPGHPFQAPLAEDVAAEVASMSPRVMRRALFKAAGTAALRDSSSLSVADVRAVTATLSSGARRPMGFLD